MDPNSALLLSILAVIAASPNGKGNQTLLNAYLKQSGIESNLSNYGEHLERQHLSNEARIYLGYMTYISKTVIDRKIVFKWSF